MTNNLAEELELLSEYLEIDRQRGAAAAYSKAAQEIRRMDYIPPDPSEINGVGEIVREDIADYQQYDCIPRLEELKKKHPYYETFREVEHIGPVLSQNLGRAGVESKDQLKQAIETGDILEVDGIGQRTADKIYNGL